MAERKKWLVSKVDVGGAIETPTCIVHIIEATTKKVTFGVEFKDGAAVDFSKTRNTLLSLLDQNPPETVASSGAGG